MKALFTEDNIIEQPSIALFAEMGWQTADCYHETFGSEGSLGRDTSSEVVLQARLCPALERLNPSLPQQAYQLAIDELSRDRSLMSMAHANQEVYNLLNDGVKVTFRDELGEDAVETVYLIDWDTQKITIIFWLPNFGFQANYTVAGPI